MQFLLNWLGSFAAAWFTHLATRIGLQQTLVVAFLVVWYALIASLTAAANFCAGPAGVCGSIASGGTGGLSQWVMFGMSLVPSEAIQICACLVSLHAAGWSAIVLGRIVKHKVNATTGTGMITR
jgi:hypothetical protein